jgi:hypothetical protein
MKQLRPKHIPQRSCVACRQKFEKRRLTRLVATADAGVIIDPTGKRNGRGAYLCDQPACWDKVTQKPGILEQALKTSLTAEELTTIAAKKPVNSEQ